MKRSLVALNRSLSPSKQLPPPGEDNVDEDTSFCPQQNSKSASIHATARAVIRDSTSSSIANSFNIEYINSTSRSLSPSSATKWNAASHNNSIETTSQWMIPATMTAPATNIPDLDTVAAKSHTVFTNPSPAASAASVESMRALISRARESADRALVEDSTALCLSEKLKVMLPFEVNCF